jgi:acetyl-CoA carboxylase biotin carboxylase subunit
VGQRGEQVTAKRHFEKVLVANRGEIARRVMRTLREMGIASVAVYSDADASAPHVEEADQAVRIGPAPSRESYLAIDRIIEVAGAVGADAIHPGYGFLAENAEFAERCAEAGLVFIGPPAEAIRKMGSKIEAKAIMAAAGVPVIPGCSGEGLSDDALAGEARKIGFPVLIKASAGGGGKGMRIAGGEAELPQALAAARREASSAFGDDTLLLERYFEAPRHIEVQIFGDAKGRVIHLGERECSVQRRYQKIIEEAPSTAVDEKLRGRLGAAAVAAGEAIGYQGAGTVEFIMDQSGDFYFLEVNTRLQVEHPVTEAVTGLDLVRLQVEIAEGSPLEIEPEAVAMSGHAIEARLYAEDPANDFLPQTGGVALWETPELPGLRYDSGIESGTEVGPHYDPMLAKIIAHGATRDDAIRRLVRALRDLGVAGVVTNREFLLAVLTHSAFAAGETDTHFIDRHLPAEARSASPDPAADRLHAIVATLYDHQRRRRIPGPLPPSIPSGWRNNPWRRQDVSYRVGGQVIEVLYEVGPSGSFEVEASGSASRALVVEAGEGDICLEIDGIRRRFSVATGSDVTFVHGPLGTAELAGIPRFAAHASDDVAGSYVAPMPGAVREVRVSVGDRVEEGTVMLVLEAMKMEHPITAHGPGVVSEVRVEVDQMVEPDEVLVVVEADE